MLSTKVFIFYIMLTCSNKVDLLTLHQGFSDVYIIFLFSLYNIYSGYLLEQL